MVLYTRFVMSLAFGLCGLGLVLTVVIDELFGDWNAVISFHEWLSACFAARAAALRRDRVDDLHAALERARASAAASRELQQRRDRLNELASVERKLQAPRGVVVTPLPGQRQTS